MPDILHRAGIKSSVDEVYAALTTRDGLADWWTQDTHGDTNLGGVIRFRFKQGGIDMKVVELQPSRRVRWEVVDGPQEWIGTTVSFDLKQDGEYAIVLFNHHDWKEVVDFMYHCSTKWGMFLMSVKALLETGKGASHPHDVIIGDWG
ncbi:MAG: SRPBCC domain-containing protein [bacterium]